VESDTGGTPINRITRSVVYQRAKQQLSSTPFGTQLDIYAAGYEWINHSMNPLDLHDVKPEELRVLVGNEKCKQPYSLSIFNISAMSFGALSKNAIEALNLGAKIGKFAHNTGEGSASPYHLKHGGDLVWQIGTGYFGCRTADGKFNDEAFKEKSQAPQIKMIEIKLSQGAKPGHGGILPAAKNTEEIAHTRMVEPHTKVLSPSCHKEFHDPAGLIQFIQRLRDLSGGKPVGFKLCVGNPMEFFELCQEMKKQDNYPDFITVDGSEGGTGAAPLEFSNSIGMSLTDGIIIVSNTLMQFGLRDKIRIIAAGKILTGFDIIKTIALGADACYSARGMMLALGCIQALECNSNKCPTGVATQDPQLVVGLDIPDKSRRVANFHFHTLEAAAEILAATGLRSTKELNRSHIWRRISPTDIRTYEQLYPYIEQVHSSQSKAV
jgi:glutamate synthase domain-containing protein 2